MKAKSVVVSLALVTGSLFFVAPSALAGECSVEDPCQTYAMVDGSGVVTNIIVCQPSVCGSGTFAGSRVVPQVAASSQGQNQGGYLNLNGAPVTESNGVFTVTNPSPTVNSSTTQSQGVQTEIVTTFEPGITSSFTFNDTVGKPDGRPTMTTNPIDNSIGATLSVTEFESSETETVRSEEVAVFEKRETEQFVELTLQLNNLQKIMRNWNWFKMSLIGWFL
jgi:hypothetical protein